MASKTPSDGPLRAGKAAAIYKEICGRIFRDDKPDRAIDWPFNNLVNLGC